MEMPQTDGRPAGNTGKQAYDKPQLQRFGSVTQLTKAANNAGPFFDDAPQTVKTGP